MYTLSTLTEQAMQVGQSVRFMGVRYVVVAVGGRDHTFRPTIQIRSGQAELTVHADDRRLETSEAAYVLPARRSNATTYLGDSFPIYTR
jgi:hypothetical protein